MINKTPWKYRKYTLIAGLADIPNDIVFVLTLGKIDLNSARVHHWALKKIASNRRKNK